MHVTITNITRNIINSSVILLRYSFFLLYINSLKKIYNFVWNIWSNKCLWNFFCTYRNESKKLTRYCRVKLHDSFLQCSRTEWLLNNYVMHFSHSFLFIHLKLGNLGRSHFQIVSFFFLSLFANITLPTIR